MKKKLNIPKDFRKDFKDRKDFDEFFSELFKEGLNQMLKAEIIEKAIFGPVTTDILASVVQLHPNCELLFEPVAASHVKDKINHS